MLQTNLTERLKAIDDFFDNLSDDDFEVMAFECGLGQIGESSKSDYVLAMNEGYVNSMYNLTSSVGNEFDVNEDSIIKGAA